MVAVKEAGEGRVAVVVAEATSRVQVRAATAFVQAADIKSPISLDSAALTEPVPNAARG